MPMAWESVLQAGGVPVVMEASPATGYVARLDSLDGYVVDWPAPEGTLDGPLKAFAIIPSPELKAYRARVRSQARGISPQAALREGVKSIVFGPVGLGIAAWFLVDLLVVLPADHSMLAVVSVLSMATLALSEMWATMQGIRFIVTARRGLRLANEPNLAVEGTVSSACLALDGLRPGGFPSVYIELAVDDETKLIFRVPGRFAHRVLVGNQVRVECNRITEVVTEVTMVERRRSRAEVVLLRRTGATRRPR
jgi:hypothetical protein